MAGDDRSKRHSAKAHVRGSTLLLLGRGLSLSVNLAVQVLTVRYLSKLDYGAFAYALSFVSVCAMLIIFNLDKAASRFLPMYQEEGEHEKLSGAIVLIAATILTLGLAVVLGTLALRDVLGEHVVSDQLSLTLLLMLVVLAPIEAYDAIFVSMFASFASPWAIFVRRHVLGPGLKLAAVVITILAHQSVEFLAVAYLCAGAAGIAINGLVLYVILRDQGILARFSPSLASMPARELYLFSAPLLSSNLAVAVQGTLAVVVLESLASATAVADFRAVLPIARLNEVVLVSFSFLFVPLASRLFAHDDLGRITDLYWQSTAWVAVFTLPIFLICSSFAQPVTVVLFGEQYVDSARVLTLLSVGYFTYAVFGFSIRTLRVYNAIRYIVCADLCATAIALLLFWLLIPEHGALGAAVAACATMVLHAALNQLFVYLATGITPMRWRYLRLYGLIALSALLLDRLRTELELSLLSGIPAVVAIWLFFVTANRSLLDVESTFPELLRLPVVRGLLRSPRRAT